MDVGGDVGLVLVRDFLNGEVAFVGVGAAQDLCLCPESSQTRARVAPPQGL